MSESDDEQKILRRARARRAKARHVAQQKSTWQAEQQQREQDALVRDIMWLAPAFKVLSSKCRTSTDGQRARKQAQVRKERTEKRNEKRKSS